MNTLIRLSLLTGLLAIAFTGYSQTYRTAIGARFEETGYGLSVAQKVGRKVTLEGIVMDNAFDQTQGYLLAKRHIGFLQRRLNVYVGAGLHTGFEPDNNDLNGYDVIGGAELTLFRFTLAADVKPEWSFATNEYQGLNPSVSLRYVLFRDRSRNCSRSCNW